MTYTIDDNGFGKRITYDTSSPATVTDRNGNEIPLGNIEAIKVDPDSKEWVLVVKDEEHK